MDGDKLLRASRDGAHPISEDRAAVRRLVQELAVTLEGLRGCSVVRSADGQHVVHADAACFLQRATQCPRGEPPASCCRTNSEADVSGTRHERMIFVSERDTAQNLIVLGDPPVGALGVEGKPRHPGCEADDGVDLVVEPQPETVFVLTRTPFPVSCQPRAMPHHRRGTQNHHGETLFLAAMEGTCPDPRERRDLDKWETADVIDALRLPIALDVQHRVLTLRRASEADLGALMLLLADDPISATRGDKARTSDAAAYRSALTAIIAEPSNELLVVEEQDVPVATLQLTRIPGLARRGTTRLLVEAVRVRSDARSAGIGSAMMRWVTGTAAPVLDAALVQLTSDEAREDAHRFYERLGFVGSHRGFKYTVA